MSVRMWETATVLHCCGKRHCPAPWMACHFIPVHAWPVNHRCSLVSPLGKNHPYSPDSKHTKDNDGTTRWSTPLRPVFSVLCAFTPSMSEAEAGRCIDSRQAWSAHQVPGQLGQHTETLSHQNQTRQKSSCGNLIVYSPGM